MTKFEDIVKSLDVTGVAFVNLAGYKNTSGEIQDALINVGMSYENALKKDKEFLESLNPGSLEDLAQQANVSVEIIQEARESLLASVTASIHKEQNNRSQGQEMAFEHLNSGIMVSRSTGEVFVKGFVVRKTVREEGDYKEDTRKPLTKAKDTLHHYLKSRQIRRYKLDNINRVSSKGDTLIIS